MEGGDVLRNTCVYNGQTLKRGINIGIVPQYPQNSGREAYLAVRVHVNTCGSEQASDFFRSLCRLANDVVSAASPKVSWFRSFDSERVQSKCAKLDGGMKRRRG